MRLSKQFKNPGRLNNSIVISRRFITSKGGSFSLKLFLKFKSCSIKTFIILHTKGKQNQYFCFKFLLHFIFLQYKLIMYNVYSLLEPPPFSDPPYYMTFMYIEYSEIH